MPTLSLNGIDLHYIDTGARADGRTLVMVHNLTSHIEGFAQNIPELSRHFRVIAADLRGHGLSTHEESADKAASFYTFDHLAGDAEALLAHLGVEDFFLFGQAYWGANTALHLYERLAPRVRGIVLSSAYMMSTEPGVKTYELLGETGRRNFIRMHELARTQGMMAVYEDRRQYGQFWSEKVRGDARILEAFAKAHRLTSAMAFVTIPHISHARRARIAALLATQRVPVMLLLGADDSNNPLMITEMRRDHADTHVMILPDSGHYPTIENPRDFNRALLDFYAGTAWR